MVNLPLALTGGLAALFIFLDAELNVAALVGFCGLLLLALMTSLDVLARWLFNQPLHGVNDLSAIALALSSGLPPSTRRNTT